ncbi:sensor histidine kinase [Novosphingobium terrae]|uniref:sensor histidine kinase n=1 Tax=Novosphingobium terrae TaxID=2726189 RepID=UPI00197D8E97|nr:sensor histidine kinase [Novosphingobium terrae]
MKLSVGRRVSEQTLHPNSTSRRWRLIVLCLLGLTVPVRLLALDPTRSIAQIHHTSWTIADGIPANIWAIDQTPDGYLWLGSVDGLYRFDGVRVERVATDKLPSPSIHALAADKSGGLWIGYERPVGAISYMRNGVVTNYPIKLKNSTSVHAFAIGPDGTVWASTPDAILRFDGRRWVPIKGDFGNFFNEGKGGVRSFGVARDGSVWMKSRGGLYFLKPGQEQFERATAYPGGPEGFTKTPDGRLWTTDPKSGHLYPMPDLAHAGLPDRAGGSIGRGVPRNIEGNILLDRDGTLWCTSLRDGGLMRVRTVAGAMILDKSTDSRGPLVAGTGLSSNLVHTLFEDREGNIWVGTSLGLDRFRPANIVTEPRVPAGFRARFVSETTQGLFAYTGWSGTDSRANDGTQALYRVAPHRAPELYLANVGRLRALFTSLRDQSIWLITQEGLQQLQGRRLAPPLALPAGVEGNSIYSAAYDTAGTLWISSFVHGVYRRTAGGWSQFPLRSSAGATGVLIADPDGSMWIRYSGGGLFRFKDGHLQDLSHNRLGIGDVTFIQPQANGVIVGGENGIGRLKDGGFQALHASQIAALSGVTGIADTADGSSWIFAQAGIVRVNTRSLDEAFTRSDPQALKYEVLDTRDGLPGAPYGAVGGSSVATDATGRVWFTTGNGLAWIDPGNLHHNPLAPNVLVTSVLADGQHYPFRQDLQLRAGTSNVQLDYTALSLSIPDRVRFRYKLDGVDADWVDAGNRRQAFYTRLGPGEYRFQVMAANSDGVWNRQGAGMAFVIAPTFFQSRFFIVLCILLFGLLVQLAYSMRLAHLSARMRSQLEGRIFERERIARELHDTLLQGFQGVMLRFQAVAFSIPSDHPAHLLLEKAMKRGDAALAEGRNRVRDLRSFEDMKDLAKTLRTLGAASPVGEEVNFSVLEDRPTRTLNPITMDEVVKICAEAIHNAFRHSGADNIQVSIHYERDALRILIDDDGKGIAPEILAAGRREGHFGLIGMRERASKINAAITFGSRVPNGTSVELAVPSIDAYADISEGRWEIRSFFRKIFK